MTCTDISLTTLTIAVRKLVFIDFLHTAKYFQQSVEIFDHGAELLKTGEFQDTSASLRIKREHTAPAS